MDFGVGPFPGGLAIADFNKDGFFDLVVPDVSDEFGVLYGDRGGRFAARRFYSAQLQDPVNQPILGLAPGDLNRDGNVDFAGALYGGSAVVVFLGTSRGAFPTHFTIPAADGVQGLALGDVNGDKYDDIVTTSRAGNIMSVMLNNGNSTFQSHVDYPTLGEPGFVLLKDVNRDGSLDVIVAEFKYLS
ncbi:MAG: VCBS repeat-containing protein, partial [Acidobacteriales bacterium]|nr:VCBS repeat-containing protein [Terriglobales bacterium]